MRRFNFIIINNKSEYKLISKTEFPLSKANCRLKCQSCMSLSFTDDADENTIRVTKTIVDSNKADVGITAKWNIHVGEGRKRGTECVTCDMPFTYGREVIST